MARRLTPTVEWLSVCHPVEGHHEHVSVYLVEHDGSYLLVDSGSFHHEAEIRSAIEAATDGAGIDAILLSHSDYPHSANVEPFREEWADVELVASSGSPAIQGLSDARRCVIGEDLDVLGRTFSFVDPPLADRSHTTWIHDDESKVLFTADGFGNYHDDGCDRLSTEFDGGVPVEAIYRYHAENLVWLRYVDPAKLRRALDDIFDRYEVSAVAPIHGNPILAADLPDYLDRLEAAASRIADGYDVPPVDAE
ncbi:MBL fold metallo-hydrolase [Halomarina salina]|uniref:MBL fold metallo-hydrolase n=1 Tax=Halomarina salina TaxID=1872699 RepID=A0ABD5RSS1_9EURY|nr:MBL fold metallo-hydrolase [Halomarina salina]